MSQEASERWGERERERATSIRNFTSHITNLFCHIMNASMDPPASAVAVNMNGAGSTPRAERRRGVGGGAGGSSISSFSFVRCQLFLSPGKLCLMFMICASVFCTVNVVSFEFLLRQLEQQGGALTSRFLHDHDDVTAGNKIVTIDAAKDDSASSFLSTSLAPLQAYEEVEKYMSHIIQKYFPHLQESDAWKKKDKKTRDELEHQKDALYINDRKVSMYMDKVISNLPEPTGLDVVYDRSSNSSNDERRRLVAIAFSNSEFFKSGLVQNWLCWLQQLQITNFVLVVIDQEAADLAANLPEEMLPTEAVHWDPTFWKLEDGDSQSFSDRLRDGFTATDRYLEFTWRRNRYIKALLKTYPDMDIVLSDADTTWNRIPWEKVPSFQKVSQADDDEEEESCDMFIINRSEDGRHVDKLRNKISVQGGFIMLHNTPNVHNVYDEWVRMALLFHKKEQPSFKAMLYHTVDHEFLYQDKHGYYYSKNKDKNHDDDAHHDVLNMCVLDRDLFPTSQDVFGLYKKDIPKDHKDNEGHGLMKKPYWKRNSSFAKVAVFHPTLQDKSMKTTVLHTIGQWFWDDDHNTCTSGSL